MALPQQTGYQNVWANTIEPINTGDWTDLTTWDVASWNPTATSLLWISNPVSLDQSQTVNFLLESTAQGTVEYDVYASDTGAFAGEETVTSIASGDTGVSAFTGKHFYVAARVTNNSSLPVLYSMTVTITTNKYTKITLNDIDTSTLAGTVSARTVDFGRTVSGVKNMQITVKQVTDYTLDVYVSDYPTCSVVIPRIVDKATPSIALVGLDNVPRDGIVDISAEILPEQYMSGNNLLLR